MGNFQSESKNKNNYMSASKIKVFIYFRKLIQQIPFYNKDIEIGTEIFLTILGA
jgi:hypothetical protein